MKCLQFSSGLILSLFSFSCMNNANTLSSSDNDTTIAVEYAVRTALQSNRPEFDSIRAKIKARDTIFLTTDSLPLADLPEKIDSTTLKIMGHRELCADTQSTQSREYLYIRAFEKNDTGYYVSVQSLNCKIASNGEALGVFIAKRKTKGGKVVKDKGAN